MTRDELTWSLSHGPAADWLGLRPRPANHDQPRTLHLVKFPRNLLSRNAANCAQGRSLEGKRKLDLRLDSGLLVLDFFIRTLTRLD